MASSPEALNQSLTVASRAVITFSLRLAPMKGEGAIRFAAQLAR